MYTNKHFPSQLKNSSVHTLFMFVSPNMTYTFFDKTLIVLTIQLK